MTEKIEYISQLMLMKEQPENESWEELCKRTENELVIILNENPLLANRIQENCVAISICSPSISSESIYAKYIRYLTTKYAYRRLLLRTTHEHHRIAAEAIQEVEPFEYGEDKGRLILIFHYGHYLQATVSFCQKNKVIFAARQRSTDPKYLNFLGFLESGLGVKCKLRYNDILSALIDGETVLLSPDNANFEEPEKNKAYNINDMRVYFNSSTDALITQSQCQVGYLQIRDDAPGIIRVRCEQVPIAEGQSGLQVVLGSYLNKEMIQKPWEWDRIKYLHRIMNPVGTSSL